MGARFGVSDFGNAFALPALSTGAGPEITWTVTWIIALLVSLGGACSAHVWLLELEKPTWEIFVFNGLIFGGFFIGFATTGHLDHKVRLGIRS